MAWLLLLSMLLLLLSVTVQLQARRATCAVVARSLLRSWTGARPTTTSSCLAVLLTLCWLLTASTTSTWSERFTGRCWPLLMSDQLVSLRMIGMGDDG